MYRKWTSTRVSCQSYYPQTRLKMRRQRGRSCSQIGIRMGTRNWVWQRWTWDWDRCNCTKCSGNQSSSGTYKSILDNYIYSYLQLFSTKLVTRILTKLAQSWFYIIKTFFSRNVMQKIGLLKKTTCQVMKGQKIEHFFSNKISKELWSVVSFVSSLSEINNKQSRDIYRSFLFLRPVCGTRRSA